MAKRTRHLRQQRRAAKHSRPPACCLPVKLRNCSYCAAAGKCQQRSRRGLFKRKPDPTPSEIAAACREIQAGWTESERARRANGPDVRWKLPTVAVELPEPDTSERWWYIC